MMYPRLKRLTDRHKKFVKLYLLYGEGARAAREAGYSQKTAGIIAYQLLQNSLIQAEIRQQRDLWSARTDITIERITKERARLAFMDARTFFTWGPTGVVLTSSDQLSEDETVCVAEVSQTITEAGGTIRLKLHDKKGALDALAKQFGVDKELPLAEVHVHLESARQRVTSRLSALAEKAATNGHDSTPAADPAG